MDSSERLDALKDAIEQNHLSTEEIEERLRCAVNAELNKPSSEMDTAFLNACEDLLYRIGTGEAYVGNRERSMGIALAKHRDGSKRTSARKRVMIRAGIVASIMLSMVADTETCGSSIPCTMFPEISSTTLGQINLR